MFQTTRIALLAAVTAAGIAGCTTTQDKVASNQLAAEAATTTYPSEKAELSTMVGSVIHPGSSIEIINFGNHSISDADVWINNTYVTHLDSLPANSTVSLDFGKFFNKSGMSLTAANVRVNTVQLSSAHKLWTLLGPVNTM